MWEITKADSIGQRALVNPHGEIILSTRDWSAQRVMETVVRAVNDGTWTLFAGTKEGRDEEMRDLIFHEWKDLYF